jgi:hypothetical protein
MYLIYYIDNANQLYFIYIVIYHYVFIIFITYVFITQCMKFLFIKS